MSSPGNIITAFVTATALGAVSIFCPPLAIPAMAATTAAGGTATIVGIKTGDKKLESFGESILEGVAFNI